MTLCTQGKPVSELAITKYLFWLIFLIDDFKILMDHKHLISMSSYNYKRCLLSKLNCVSKMQIRSRVRRIHVKDLCVLAERARGNTKKSCSGNREKQRAHSHRG